jgi:SagB-type dehydrogenase family enzyme
MHEIEIYLAVNRSEEIESGMYHYNAEKHCLEMVRHKDEHCNQLLLDAASAANLLKTPDILIILGYRPHRLAWKYHGIVYSLVLKHVGIIFQQLYLVSTALGLAPCALGVGNSRTFRYAAMNDSSQEIMYSVGEFIVGSKPDSEHLE